MIGNGQPEHPGRTWKVGALARATGLTVRTLHYYDQIGLLQPSARLAGGHRLYDATDVARLYQIIRLRQLGLPLSQVAEVLAGPEWQLAPDVDAAHDYIVRVFGLVSGQVWKSDDGVTQYREVRAGEQVIGLHPAGGKGFRSPRSTGAVTGTTVISVDDTDVHYARTVAAGAQIVCEPVDQPYGIREYGASDPEGQIWWFQSPARRSRAAPATGPSRLAQPLALPGAGRCCYKATMPSAPTAPGTVTEPVSVREPSTLMR